MQTLEQRSGASVLGEMLAWLGAGVPLEPEVRVEEWVEGDRRIIRADIPGVDPQQDIELTVEGSRLYLRGQRREEEHDEYHSELRYGSFERIVTLPAGTSASDVTATYAAGVLTVSMPAQPAAVTARIPVTDEERPAG